MSDKQIGYKIVRLSESGSMSPIIKTDCGVVYRLGETTTRTLYQGPFAVFKDLYSARAFGMKFNEVTVKVEFSPSDEKYVWVMYSGGSSSLPLESCPLGTLLADSVTPIEIIKNSIGSWG